MSLPGENFYHISTPPIEDVPYGHPYWDPAFDQGSPAFTDTKFEVGRQLRECSIIPTGKEIRSPKLWPEIVPKIEVEVQRQSLWSRVITKDLKEETRYIISLRDYKRYTIYFRWASGGPRWWGQI
jgi:hypothetical protein